MLFQKNKLQSWHRIGTLTVESCIDRRRSLAAVLPKEVSMDTQRDIWLWRARALPKRDYIHAEREQSARVQ